MRETGEVRKDLTGDTEAAAPYMGVARVLLGQLKNRMAQGGLGQLARSYNLPDGTTIVVSSRLGQDTIRIDAAAVPPGSEPQLPPQPEVLTPEFEQPEPPEPPEPPDVPQPYMWIGARYRWEDHPALIGTVPHEAMQPGSLVLTVMEPGANGMVMSKGVEFWTNSQQSVQYPGSSPTLPIDDMVTDFLGRYPWVPDGMHNLNFNLWKVGSLLNGMMFTKHGLRLYSIDMCDPANPDESLQPYDPLGKAVDRVVPPLTGQGLPYYDWAKKHMWDQVAVLDPYEAAGIPPADKRKETAWARELLARSGVKTGLDSVIGGNYVVKVAANGIPTPMTDRPNQGTPFLTGFNYDNSADTREHLTGIYLPLRVQLEVRLGKMPQMTVHQFTIEAEDYLTADPRTCDPFGNQEGTGCNYTNGTNPHAANWWQGALLVNPTAGTVSRKDTYPGKAFQPAPYSIDKLWRKRYPLDLYIDARAGAAFPPGYPATIPYSFAYYVYRALDKQACAFYYVNTEIVNRTIDELAALAPSSTGRIWLYDVIGNTFTDVTPAVTTGAAWWNTLRDQSLTTCRNPLWIDLLGSSGIFVSGESTRPDVGQACCQDVYFGG